MDHEIEQDDLDGAAWHQVEQEERARREEQMLTDDPEYKVFLLNYEVSNSVVRTNHS
jgi:hypothetical protein